MSDVADASAAAADSAPDSERRGSGRGRGRDLGPASVRRALAALLNRRVGGLLPSPAETTELFNAAAFDVADAAGDAEDAAAADEEDAAADADATADAAACAGAGAGGAAEVFIAAQRLPGRRIDADGARVVLAKICARVMARVDAEAPVGSPLPPAARACLRDCVEEAVAETEAAGAPMSLRQFNDNSVCAVFDALYRLFLTDRDE